MEMLPEVFRAVKRKGYRVPTPIQRKSIPPALEGRDVVAMARTGSGKTAAFALPVLQKLSEDPFGVFAVVLSPARELAAQIADAFAALGVNATPRAPVLGVNATPRARESKDPLLAGSHGMSSAGKTLSLDP